MGKQYNKVIKRKRRLAYNVRKEAATTAAAATPVKPKPAAKPAAAKPKAPAKPKTPKAAAPAPEPASQPSEPQESQTPA